MLKLKKFLSTVLLTLCAVVPVVSQAASPGCVGRMWNPLTDLDYRLMGGISIAGFKFMESPKNLEEPPKHKPQPVCACKDGLNSGVGVGLAFWMPSYINDLARQSGCMGFLGGTNILPGFISQSSGQEYSTHTPGKEGVTNMQVHWAYADVAALAGKSLFERCGAVNGSMTIAYMTEPDFVFQNDVYSVIMSPQAAILAAAPILSQMTCGFESIANTLGGWQDWGVCAWKGTRLPYSGTSISKDSAQVSNMDVTVKYLTRSALLGSTLRTMGADATCQPKYSPFYDPFQHRYQWSYPGKVATRYNVDVLKWGMFIKDGGQTNFMTAAGGAVSVQTVDATAPTGGNALSMAQQVVSALPKPLNYPSREAGFMQVWEARQCCMIIFTIKNIIKMVLENLFTGGAGLAAQLYEYMNWAMQAYEVIKDPIGAALGFVGDQLALGIGELADSIGLSDSLSSITSGLAESIGVGP